MKLIIFLDKRSINDATIFYIDLILEVYKQKGYVCDFVYTIKELVNVNSPDIVFTVTTKFAFLAKIIKPRSKHIFWSQGVEIDEYLLINNKDWKYLIKLYIEKYVFKDLDFAFFVSDSLKQYYISNYGYKDVNNFTMPCFNLEYVFEDFIDKNKYLTPSFVYAGNLAAWQCFDETLLIFKNVQSVLTNATLTILTGDIDEANARICKYEISNVDVKYVQLTQLQAELAKYKYGFLIRENITVNNVATPTKLNSYLASGCIPIYTDVIDSFKQLDLGNFQLNLNLADGFEQMASKIIDFDRKVFDYQDFIKVVRSVMNDYYSRAKYIKALSQIL